MVDFERFVPIPVSTDPADLTMTCVISVASNDADVIINKLTWSHSRHRVTSHDLPRPTYRPGAYVILSCSSPAVYCIYE